jgi:hypothetical protein
MKAKQSKLQDSIDYSVLKLKARQPLRLGGYSTNDH